MGEEVLGLDRRFHPVLAQYLPADVDLKGRVRRVWTDNRAPQVLLSRNSWSRQSLQFFTFTLGETACPSNVPNYRAVACEHLSYGGEQVFQCSVPRSAQVSFALGMAMAEDFGHDSAFVG